jgi:hypothetical protein
MMSEKITAGDKVRAARFKVAIGEETISVAATTSIWPNSGFLEIKSGPLGMTIQKTSERKALIRALVECDKVLDEYEAQFPKGSVVG